MTLFFEYTGYIVSNSRMNVTNELEKIGKEVVMASPEVLSQHFTSGTENNIPQ